MAVDIFKSLFKDLENTSIVDDAVGSAEFLSYLDSGSYTLNAAFSGSLYKGIPDNKIICFAGPEQTGKTFLVLGLEKTFLDRDPLARGMHYDSEGATTKEMMQQRGLDVTRIARAEPQTIQGFVNHAMNVLDRYEKLGDEQFPFFMALDSLGMLPTAKEMADAISGNDAKDMTRTTAIRSLFRTITQKLAQLRIPLFVTNHTYAAIMTYGAPQKMSGGGGILYAASQIMMLSKSKIKEGEGADTKIVGNIIKVKIQKSRFSRENETIETRILYSGGLDRYYGLLDFALDSGVFVKEGHSIVHVKSGEKLGKPAEIELNGEKYFTKEILNEIEPWVNEKYQYGMPKEEDLDAELKKEMKKLKE